MEVSAVCQHPGNIRLGAVPGTSMTHLHTFLKAGDMVVTVYMLTEQGHYKKNY